MTALAEYKLAEDAYVAAVLATQSAEAEARRQNGGGLGAKAKALAASVLFYVLDPVAEWLRGTKR